MTVLFLLPFGVQAKCDLSVKHIRLLSQYYLDGIYAYNPMGLKKPRLIVSNRKVHGYYAEELRGVITIYPKSFNDCYCDQYFDGLTPFVAEVVDHEYTHFLDEKLHLSKRIGNKSMSEKTAYIGEHIFDDLIWHNGYAAKELAGSDINKYTKFMHVIKALSF